MRRAENLILILRNADRFLRTLLFPVLLGGTRLDHFRRFAHISNSAEPWRTGNTWFFAIVADALLRQLCWHHSTETLVRFFASSITSDGFEPRTREDSGSAISPRKKRHNTAYDDGMRQDATSMNFTHTSATHATPQNRTRRRQFSFRILWSTGAREDPVQNALLTQ
jgi:hypothetical protein